MKKSLAVCMASVALVALAVFAPTNASAQVNIYVGPGGYAHYGYENAYPITDTATATILLRGLLPSLRLRLLRRISRLLRWLLGPWTSGSASRLASSRGLGLIRVSMVIGRHCFAKVADVPSGPWTEIVTTSGNNRLI